jgi:hypothetical protein
MEQPHAPQRQDAEQLVTDETQIEVNQQQQGSLGDASPLTEPKPAQERQDEKQSCLTIR